MDIRVIRVIKVIGVMKMSPRCSQDDKKTIKGMSKKFQKVAAAACGALVVHYSQDLLSKLIKKSSCWS